MGGRQWSIKFLDAIAGSGFVAKVTLHFPHVTCPIDRTRALSIAFGFDCLVSFKYLFQDWVPPIEEVAGAERVSGLNQFVCEMFGRSLQSQSRGSKIFTSIVDELRASNSLATSTVEMIYKEQTFWFVFASGNVELLDAMITICRQAGFKSYDELRRMIEQSLQAAIDSNRSNILKHLITFGQFDADGLANGRYFGEFAKRVASANNLTPPHYSRPRSSFFFWLFKEFNGKSYLNRVRHEDDFDDDLLLMNDSEVFDLLMENGAQLRPNCATALINRSLTTLNHTAFIMNLRGLKSKNFMNLDDTTKKTCIDFFRTVPEEKLFIGKGDDYIKTCVDIFGSEFIDGESTKNWIPAILRYLNSSQFRKFGLRFSNVFRNIEFFFEHGTHDIKLQCSEALSGLDTKLQIYVPDEFRRNLAEMRI